MVRLLILIMLGSVALAIAHFFFKSIPMGKKIITVGGGLIAAMAAVALQGNYPSYMLLIAIVGVALLVTLVYVKLEEKRQLEKQRYAKERKGRVAAASSSKNTTENSFSMNPVETGKGEQ